jgi:hypothetical protein
MADYSLDGESPRENRRTFDLVVADSHNTEQPSPHPKPLLSFLLLLHV